MTSSSASSPSLSKLAAGSSPSQQDDAASAAARFNPLFIHTATHAAQPHGLRNRGYSSPSTLGPSSVAQIHSQSGNFIADDDKSKARHRKLAANPPSSPNLHEPEPPVAITSRKVQVVYYLCRSGQLEHPHLLEVTVPSHQGLHLRDVKKRLAVIRGKLLPAAFAWSYKRSYKNGYVWQDLCDDDLIFPAHGCEYVLKGSEILADQRTVASEEASAQDAFTESRSVTQSGVAKEDKVLPCRGPKLLFYDEPACPVMGHASMHVSMVENGTDAATQTEEDARSSAENDSNDHDQSHKGLHSKHEGFLSTKSHRGSFTSTRPQKATELNKAEIASPPCSSSTTDSPSPYNELASATSSSNSVGDYSTDRSKPAVDLIKPGSKTPGRPWMIKSIQELDEQDESPSMNAANNGQESSANGFLATNDSTSRKVKYSRSVPGNGAAPVATEEALHLPTANMKPGRAKQSSALSLLQFMSCGGLDIKEQILPMSLYRLRSRGTPGMTNQFVMSNYVLSPEHSSCDSFITYSGSDSVKPWSRVGKLKSLGPEGLPNGSKPVGKLGVEYVNGELDTVNSRGQCHHPQSIQGNSLSPEPGSGSMAKVQGVSMSDVISIARSSMSDRSTNVSHELDYQASNMIAMLKKSGDLPNISINALKDPPRLVTDVRPELSSDPCRNLSGVCHNEPTEPAITARAVSGEVFVNKSSPLFVPSRRHLSYSGNPLNNYVASGAKPLSQSVKLNHLQPQTDQGNNVMLMRQDAHNRNTLCSGASCNPSRAFSDGEVSCMLSNRNALSKSGDQASGLTINGYDQSMAQLWEELLAAPSAVLEEHQHKDGDLRRVRQLALGGSTAWEVERTLQNAVELSLQPPLENHLLNVDCPHCGRKMKSELMKAHMKSCSSPKSPSSSKSATTGSHYSCLNANLNSFGKSPKSNSNLCQRFLRASPTNL